MTWSRFDRVMLAQATQPCNRFDHAMPMLSHTFFLLHIFFQYIRRNYLSLQFKDRDIYFSLSLSNTNTRPETHGDLFPCKVDSCLLTAAASIVRTGREWHRGSTRRAATTCTAATMATSPVSSPRQGALYPQCPYRCSPCCGVC